MPKDTSTAADEYLLTMAEEARMEQSVKADRLRRVLGETLQLGERAKLLTEQTRLFGGMPEFDSMAVVTVLIAMEQEFGIKVDHGELSADVFETLGSLHRFVESKVSEQKDRGQGC